MKRNSGVILAGGLVTAAVFGNAAAALASTTEPVDDDTTDAPITGADLEQASAVALAHTGGGRVTGTELGDEESHYEVEVTLGDGSQVDVQLNGRFDVVGTEPEGGGEDNETGDS